jgi:hypothetical protein
VCFGNLNSVFRLFQIGPRHHKLLASGVQSSLDYILEVIVVSLFPVIFSPEYGIRQVDTNLNVVNRGRHSREALRTNIDVSQTGFCSHGIEGLNLSRCGAWKMTS